jgi:hypothetical protein
MINDLELSIAKILEIKDDKKIVNGVNSSGGASHLLIELRDHLIEVYNKIGVGLLKRHLYYEE